MEQIVPVKDVAKEYVMGEARIRAADGVSFEVDRGKLVIVFGLSDAGKSTVLNILGGMDPPISGGVWVNGKGISKFSKNELTMYRRKHVGFVFQFYNLMPNLTALENVEIAAQVCDDPMNSITVLAEVGLGERTANFPAQLSSGEQQWVSIARAAAKSPTLFLHDEPTGTLDYMTGKSILKLLQHANRELEKTIMIITHNSVLAPMADKVVRVKNGKAEAVERNEAPIPVERIEW